MQDLTADVIIIGGGVVGMTSALSLADAGCRVVLLEAGQLGQEASWAGGGIMTPLYPWRYPQVLERLLISSLAQMSVMAVRLQAETGIDPEIYETGLWVLALSEQERTEALAWAARQGWPVSEQSLRCFEAPAQQGLWFPSVNNVRNPRLVQGLAVLLKQHARVKIREEAAAQRVYRASAGSNGRWCVQTSEGKIEAPHVVCAAGAWSAHVLGAAGLPAPQVKPALGQMLLLAPAVTARLRLARPCPMVLSQGHYIVPRRDGHILVGSTVEYVGFEKRLAAHAQERLLGFAEQLFGCDVSGQVKAQWAGLRPDAGQALPMIGPHPTEAGLWLNTGHFRNGLVLALGSADLLRQQMLSAHIGSGQSGSDQSDWATEDVFSAYRPMIEAAGELA